MVNLAGSFGGAIANAGNRLVDFGDKKIKRAKADALKKELEAKERAKLNATNAKNRVLAPEATRRLAAVYGIDEKSPLYKPGAPSKFNADLSLVDFGKESEAAKPTLKFVKQNKDGEYINYYSDGSSKPTGRYAPKQSLKSEAYRTKDIRVKGKNYIAQYNPKTGKYENTWQLSANQPVKKSSSKAKTQKPVYVRVDALTPAQRYYAQVHNLKTYKDGYVVVDRSQIPETIVERDKDFGNEEVK